MTGENNKLKIKNCSDIDEVLEKVKENYLLKSIEFYIHLLYFVIVIIFLFLMMSIVHLERKIECECMQNDR